MIALPIALLGSFVCGICHVSTGIAFSKMMPLLGIPFEYVHYAYPDPEYKTMTAKEVIESETITWSLLMVYTALTLGLFTMITRISYGVLGTNCT